MSVISRPSLFALDDPMMESRVQILIKRGKVQERIKVMEIMEAELVWSAGLPMSKDQVVCELRLRNNNMMDELIRRLAYLDKDLECVVGASPPRMTDLMRGPRMGQQAPLNLVSLSAEPGYSRMAMGGAQGRPGASEETGPMVVSGEERVVITRKAPQVPLRARGKEGLQKPE